MAMRGAVKYGAWSGTHDRYRPHVLRLRHSIIVVSTASKASRTSTSKEQTQSRNAGTMDPCMIMNGSTMGPCNSTTMSGMGTNTSKMPGMGTGGSTMPGMDMSSMSDHFHFGYNETILFSFWKITSVGGLIGSMFAIFIAGVLYQGLRTFSDIVVHRSFKSRNKLNGNKFRWSLFFDWKYVLLSVLYGTLLTLNYTFMLIFMTYNYWLAGSVVFGVSVGYFLFGWMHSAAEHGC